MEDSVVLLERNLYSRPLAGLLWERQKVRESSIRTRLGKSSKLRMFFFYIGELSTVCAQIVLECLYLARIGRIHMLWSVNKLARAFTKWPESCDKRLARLISYIHHTSEYRQCCCVQRCSQDSDFARDLEDSKSTSGGVLCIFGSHTFVPISWICKKQTSVSHSSTEAEIIFVDAGSRMDGIPALTLWHLVIEVFQSEPNRTDGPKKEPRANPSAVIKPNMHNPYPNEAHQRHSNKH